MRVLHFPTLVGGNPPALARAEREIGLDSTCVADVPTEFGWSGDKTLCPEGAGLVRRARARLRAARKYRNSYDVVHFNAGQTALNRFGLGLDIPGWKRAGATVCMTFQGSDIRPESLLSPLSARTLRGRASDLFRRQFARNAARWCDHLFCLNPDLLDHVQGAEFLPYCSLDLARLPLRETRSEGRIRIVHAPTRRDVKGTSFVLEAAEKLQDPNLDWRIVEGKSNQEVLKELSQADIVIDQLRIGWYGAFAMEAMAMGIPTICWIDPVMLSRTPTKFAESLPIIVANQDTLVGVVSDLSRDHHRRALISELSKAFVKRFHHPRKIAHAMKRVYEDPSSSFWSHFGQDQGSM